MADKSLKDVALNVLRQSEHRFLALDLNREQRILGTQSQQRGVAVKGHVDRIVIVAVHHGGNLVITPDTTRGALTELGTLLCLEVNDVCHGGISFSLT